jgi:hypothetical protein
MVCPVTEFVMGYGYTWSTINKLLFLIFTIKLHTTDVVLF